MKKYIDEELNPVKVNVIDPEKENYNPPLTIHEIPLKLDISKEDYYHALFISVDMIMSFTSFDYQIHVLSVTILTQVQRHGKHIWISDQSSTSIKPLHICVPIFQNL